MKSKSKNFPWIIFSFRLIFKINILSRKQWKKWFSFIPTHIFSKAFSIDTVACDKRQHMKQCWRFPSPVSMEVLFFYFLFTWSLSYDIQNIPHFWASKNKINQNRMEFYLKENSIQLFKLRNNCHKYSIEYFAARHFNRETRLNCVEIWVNSIYAIVERITLEGIFCGGGGISQLQCLHQFK